MSSNMIKLGLLSLLSTALAVPVLPSGTGAHHPHGTGMAFPAGNDTNAYFPTASGSGRRFRHKTTTTQTRESTTIITEYLTVSPKPVSAAANSVSTPCTSSTVSVTTTNIVTVTVQPQQSAAAPAVSSAAVEESSAPAPTVVSSAVIESPSVVATSAVVSSAAASPVAVPSAAYEAPAVVSSAVAPSVVSSAAAPSASSSDEDTADASAYQGQKQVSPVSTTVSISSVGSNKRGIAYNDKSFTTCFEGKAKLSWAYNWGQVSNGVSSSFQYIPMLWGTRTDFTANWVGNAKAALSAGAPAILGFNEPDHPAQANMDPATAAAAYKQYITNQFAGQARLGSPAVTNGPASQNMGLTWLNTFMSDCSDCQIDFVAIHWYDSADNIDYFKQHITDAHTQTGKPIWLTEFGTTSGDTNAFLNQVLPWLDQQDFVERYSYFMAGDGYLNSGTDMSSIGSTYATV